MTSLSTLSGFQGRDPEMLQTVKDACQFDPKAIDYALSDQIESLEDLVGHDAGAAEAFFKKTYVTGGMHTLLRQGLQRLAGSSGQAVFELKQSMGGGKTHSMLALGYLAANPRPRGVSSRKKSRKDSRRPRRASSPFRAARSRATSTFGATSPSNWARPATSSNSIRAARRRRTRRTGSASSATSPP